MKTAVSLPDPVFLKADQLAKQLRISRSQLYTQAVSEFVARHEPGQVTEAMNRVCDSLEPVPDQFVDTASRRILRRTQW
jgi:metal-responsive CopG/Arc/MetJ family transcriptional regulator